MPRRRFAVLLEEMANDVRFTLRLLAANRAFASIAILTFSIGVGATTAIFSVVNATLLRPLPFRQPDRLMSLFLRMPVQYGSGEIDMSWSYPKYRTLVGTQHAFAELSPHVADAFTIATPDDAEILRGESVGARYFHVLGLTPAMGRFFSDAEDRPEGGERVVVIGDGLWRERFQSSASAIGSRIEIAGSPYVVIGVAPPGFRGMTGAAQLWALYTATRPLQSLQSGVTHQFEVVARLAPGVTPAAARAAILDAGRVIDATHPDRGANHWRAAAYSLNELRVDPLVGRSVVVLAVAVSLLLLIACVNVASLLLARGAARRRELSVRLAIGASTGRLVRQLITESAVLSALGVLGGLTIAFVAVRALTAMAPVAAGNLSTVRGNLTAISLGGISVDAGAIVFSVLVAVCAGIGAGIVPAVAASRVPLADAMRQGATAAPAFAGLKRLTPRGALVVGEVALAVVLLVSSGLMMRSLARLFDAQAGYRPDHLLTARVSLNAERAKAEPVGQLWEEVLQRVGTIPGVTSVASGSCAPVGDHCEGTDVDLPGRAAPAHVSFHAVSPNYFRTLGVPVRRGREVLPDDRRDAAPVLVINETAARTIWAPDDPLRTPIPRGNGPVQVVGVVGDVRYENVEAPPMPAVFVPVAQSPRRTAMLFLRTAGDPASLGGALRRAVREVDRHHVVTDVRTMQERMFDSAARSRFATRVLTAFAAIALVLAALGIYGILSLAVAQRRRELGIRIALGADRGRMLRLVVGEALALVAVGAVLGIGGAYAGGRGMASLLYGVTPADPGTYAACAVVLAVAALGAAFVPAVRAMRVEPASVLRGD